MASRIWFLTFCVPTLSFAFPNVGDYVRYEAPYNGSPAVIEKRILSHNPETDTFLVDVLKTYRGQTLEHSVYDTERSFLYDDAKIGNVLATCTIRGGALGTVRVNGQSIKICEFYNEDSQLTNILGKVPFGVLRFQIYLQGEDFLDFYLTKFSGV